jgi:hypothetical protein
MPEKFALTWLIASIFSLMLAVFPRIIDSLASNLSIKTPTNFIFFFSIIFLAIINMQIMRELGRQGVQIKILAEKLAEHSIRQPRDEMK